MPILISIHSHTHTYANPFPYPYGHISPNPYPYPYSTHTHTQTHTQPIPIPILTPYPYPYQHTKRSHLSQWLMRKQNTPPFYTSPQEHLQCEWAAERTASHAERGGEREEERGGKEGARCFTRSVTLCSKTLTHLCPSTPQLSIVTTTK